ncbi:MAG: site-specific integrase [Candidatus Methanoperedens sp.]|nr:site-specific integrase [Candidatus Methanoperedens sp.]
MGKIRKRLPLRENQTFLTKEDVKTLLTHAPNLRMKAVILTMATSGMAKNEVINLRIRDIVFDKNNIGAVTVRREKAQVDYITFISPEATMAIKSYLDERNRDPILKVKSPMDYVFVTYGAKLMAGQTLTLSEKRGGKLADQTFTNEFKKLGEELGFGNGKGMFVKSRSHALRKFFASTLENAGMPKNKIDFMLGHTPSGNDLAYFNTDIDKLREFYKKFLPYLTFEKTIEVRSLDTKDSDRLEQLEKENARLKKEYESDTQLLKAQVEAQNKRQNEVERQMELITAAMAAKQQ